MDLVSERVIVRLEDRPRRPLIPGPPGKSRTRADPPPGSGQIRGTAGPPRFSANGHSVGDPPDGNGRRRDSSVPGTTDTEGLERRRWAGPGVGNSRRCTRSGIPPRAPIRRGSTACNAAGGPNARPPRSRGAEGRHGQIEPPPRPQDAAAFRQHPRSVAAMLQHVEQEEAVQAPFRKARGLQSRPHDSPHSPIPRVAAPVGPGSTRINRNPFFSRKAVWRPSPPPTSHKAPPGEKRRGPLPERDSGAGTRSWSLRPRGNSRSPRRGRKPYPIPQFPPGSRSRSSGKPPGIPCSAGSPDLPEPRLRRPDIPGNPLGPTLA